MDFPRRELSPEAASEAEYAANHGRPDESETEYFGEGGTNDHMDEERNG